MSEDIVAMARAAKADERLSDGALYGKLADEIEQLRAEVKAEEETVYSCMAKLKEMQAALVAMRDRDDRNGSLPAAYREIIDGVLEQKADGS